MKILLIFIIAFVILNIVDTDGFLGGWIELFAGLVAGGAATILIIGIIIIAFKVNPILGILAIFFFRGLGKKS